MKKLRRTQPDELDYKVDAGMVVDGNNELAQKVAAAMGMKAYTIRCRLLQLELGTTEIAPVLWWLTTEEMRLIHEGLLKSNDQTAIVLRNQIKAVLASIEKEKEEQAA